MGRAMVDRDLSKGKQQSLKDHVEEEIKRTPTQKTKKKKGKHAVGMSKVSPQENIPSPMSKCKGTTKESIGSLVKQTSCNS
jgi:hypothetical protein